MASLKDTSITGTLSVSGAPTFTTAVPVASGGTGATSASAALTNLGAQAALVSGTNIKTVGGASILGSGNITIAAGGLPTNSQTFTSSGTFTVPAGVTRVLVRACGAGGGGGSGSGSTNVAGGNGGNTIFGSIVFLGGSGGASSSSAVREGRLGNRPYGNALSGNPALAGGDGTYGGGGAGTSTTGTAGSGTMAGAGGGGALWRTGGASSCFDSEIVTVTPGQQITIVVGAGGSAAVYSSYIAGSGYRGEVQIYW